MKQPEITQVLLMAHGWGYNHRFFDAFLNTLPLQLRNTTLFVCLEAGYFPDQGKAGLMIQTEGKWLHHPAEALHSLVLAHAEVPWLGLGHSLGLSKLLDFSVRWHSLFSLHGFTHFTSSPDQPEGTSPRVLARMIQKAEQNMAEVLADFHLRCGHSAPWAKLDEPTLLADLRSLQTMNTAMALQKALEHGADFHGWASEADHIVPLQLAQACFSTALGNQSRALYQLQSNHAEFASAPARYTDTLLPLLSQH
ncbi:hypothetical protein [Limnobacter parvus]|uniref:Alpha/beta hydrolase n=1 Tax=Limnobacter parvus TaxID=2939690 RepID=A0ABT1XES2_9BURK|nr:hypothetical protein [Limnobacter parvus]MCR2745780.1 hypothetical protein [Limnobacter parvus]